MPSRNQARSLGEFLSRQHGLPGKIVSTTITTHISELNNNNDTNYGFDHDEWCLISPNAFNQKQTERQNIIQLTQRVNQLECTTKQLINRLTHLEKNSNSSLPLQPARKAIMGPSNSAKAMMLAIAANKPKQIGYKGYKSTLNKKFASKSVLPLQDALIMQKRMILAKAEARRSNPIPIKKIVNVEPKPRNPFQRELYERVRDPQLKESWHILKERESKNHDPHHEAVMKFCKDLMNKKSTLKRIPSPDCKTIIVLD